MDGSRGCTSSSGGGGALTLCFSPGKMDAPLSPCNPCKAKCACRVESSPWLARLEQDRIKHRLPPRQQTSHLCHPSLRLLNPSHHSWACIITLLAERQHRCYMHVPSATSLTTGDKESQRAPWGPDQEGSHALHMGHGLSVRTSSCASRASSEFSCVGSSSSVSGGCAPGGTCMHKWCRLA